MWQTSRGIAGFCRWIERVSRIRLLRDKRKSGWHTARRDSISKMFPARSNRFFEAAIRELLLQETTHIENSAGVCRHQKINSCERHGDQKGCGATLRFSPSCFLLLSLQTLTVVSRLIRGGFVHPRRHCMQSGTFSSEWLLVWLDATVGWKAPP